jgi:glutamyl endopeptidase
MEVTMNPHWLRSAALLLLSGCALPTGAHEEHPLSDAPYDDEVVEPLEPADEALLDEAPPTDVLMARGVEPLRVDIPADISRSIVVEKKVIGADNRKPIADTKVKPYSTIATLLISFPGTKATGLCTGSMIGADAVLTAGHCVYNAKYGGFASNIRVIPGTYPNASGKPAEPFGSTSGRKLYVPSAYRSATSFWQREPHDYAVVRIHAALGTKTGVRTVTTMATPKVGRFVRLTGYHGDLCKAPPCTPTGDAFIMHTSTDQIRQLFTGVFNHYADSFGGSSGAPLTSDGVDAGKIFAVHVAGLANPSTGAEWNMGVLITKTAYTNIQTWRTAP